MNNFESYEQIKIAFLDAAMLAGIEIQASEIEVQFTPAPHKKPKSLPSGKLAVYVFMFQDRCLKVGKAGHKSAARFCSQHYGASRAPSTLAMSVIKNQHTLDQSNIDESNIEAWLCKNTTRVNFFIPADKGPFTLSLLESFIQCRLQPEFEGFAASAFILTIAQAGRVKTRPYFKP